MEVSVYIYPLQLNFFFIITSVVLFPFECSTLLNIRMYIRVARVGKKEHSVPTVKLQGAFGSRFLDLFGNIH